MNKSEELKEKMVKASLAYFKAYKEAEGLWYSDGEDPPDWNERMNKRHNIMDDAHQQFLEAAKAYEESL